MPNDFTTLLLVATGFAIVLMFVTWRVALRANNLGFVDIVWSYAFLPVVLFFAVMGQGDPVRRSIMAGMAGLWSVRLGSHVARRVLSHHPVEDTRYARLRADWGAKLKSKTFWFFQLQAVLIGGLSTVFLLPCLNVNEGITPLEFLGSLIWGVAFVGESMADYQLKAFKAKPANQGRVCQDGLWNYSRHPNYFFEWLVWVGFFVFAWDSPGGCFTVLCPGLMLFFLLRVTGVPLTEELSLKSRGDAYREYQATTSVFVPWFKKKAGLKKAYL